MADSDEVLTFGADFSQVQSDLAQFAAQIQANPLRLPIGVVGAGGPANAQMLGALPAPGQSAFSGGGLAAITAGIAVAGIGSGGAGGGGASGVSLATQELVSAIRGAAQQVQVAASGGGRLPPNFLNIPSAMAALPGGGGGPPISPLMLPGPGGGGPLARRGGSGLPSIVGAGGGGRGGMPPGGGGGGEDEEGGGNWQWLWMWQQNQTANVQNNFYRGREEGEGGGGGGRGRSLGLRWARSLFRLYAGMELIHAYRGSAIAGTAAHYAETPSDALDAEIEGVDASSSGLFGNISGLALDARERWFGYGVGPTTVKQMAIEAKAMARATSRTRQDYLSVGATGRTIAGGPGKYGAGSAGIANDYASEIAKISDEREDASNIQDDAIRKDRLAGLDARKIASGRMRDYRAGQLGRDLADELAGYADQAGIAHGSMTSGAARLATIQRRISRYTTPEDKRAGDAEYGAASAEEGYHVWQGEYAATADRDQAYFSYNRQPNVGRAVGMYAHGVIAAENARRNVSSTAADLISQTTAYELAGFKRQLLDSGSATYAENGMAVDFGQGGPGGRESNNVGDDLLETVKKIMELLAVLPEIKEAL